MKNKAFTVIELLVVIAIICIVAAIVIGGIGSHEQAVQDQQLQQEKQCQQMYNAGFHDGMDVIIQHGHWTGTNVQVDAEDIIKANKNY